MDKNPLIIKNFLVLPYEELEALNLKAKADRLRLDSGELEKKYRRYLAQERRLKAITLCFSDIEGRFHMLDYDKKFFLASADNLTFDGSSVRGFTAQSESDLRLVPDWSSIMWLPANVFGPGKVILFADVHDQERQHYTADFRGVLRDYVATLKRRDIVAYASGEIEGFLFAGLDGEQTFDEKKGFSPISSGGYYHSLPLNTLRQFIDAAAEAQRAMGFHNEKDHPEVAPSQFEMNFSYTEALRACDQIQLYKLVCRQIANNMGLTASFLPKPIVGINGSGMHINFSLTKKGRNLFFDKKGEEGLSLVAHDFIAKLLNHAPEICLVLNSSVNAYRRLDPHFEAPNQIKVSARDRGSMIRIPMANQKTARLELRSVAPDANPYLVLYTILKVGFEGTPLPVNSDKRPRLRFLPGSIHDAIRIYKTSEFMTRILGESNKEKYLAYKQAVADRSPLELGTRVKTGEIIFHHEVTNQVLWNSF
jgi:glutamine synthetase